MQDETPLAPAQIITSVILLPQNFLQSALDRRGRAACCSLSGVLLAGGIQGAGGGERRSGALTQPAHPGVEETLPPPCLLPVLPHHHDLRNGAPHLPSDLTVPAGPLPLRFHTRQW